MSLLDKIANTLSSAYESTAFKVGAVLVTGSILAGCAKDYFKSIIPPDRWQAQITAGDGWGIRGQLKSDESSQNSAEFSHTDNETEIKATGNTITEKRTAVSVGIKPSNRRNFTLETTVESSEKGVTAAGVRESLTTGTALAVDLGFGNRLRGNGHLLVRPYLNTEDETSVAGNLTTTQSGVYVRGKYGLWRPLLSLDFYDFGDGIPKAQEIQAGTSVVLGGNEEYSLGYFLAALDDGTDSTVKHVFIGDATLMSGGRSFLGADVTYDGSLFGVGMHGAWNRRGGNMPQNAKRYRETIRKLQDSTFLERGRSVSTARDIRTDAAQALQSIDDVTLFGLLGIREEFDPAKAENVIKPYIMAGTNIKGVTVGATYGNVFEVYPADAVKSRVGVFSGFKLGEGRLNIAWEKREFRNLKDTSALTVYVAVPFK